jgi:hypothetical protein
MSLIHRCFIRGFVCRLAQSPRFGTRGAFKLQEQFPSGVFQMGFKAIFPRIRLRSGSFL